VPRGRIWLLMRNAPMPSERQAVTAAERAAALSAAIWRR